METTAPKIYTGNGWEVRCGKWQDSPPDVVDVVVSDPPFDDRTSKGARRSGCKDYVVNSTDPVSIGKLGHRISATVSSFGGIDPMELGPAFVAISNRWVVLFCAVEQFGKYQTATGSAWIRAGAWVKTNPTPQFTGDRPATWGEGVAIMHRSGKKRWNRGGHAAIWTCATNTSQNRVHETQKPIGLMLSLVSDFSDPGELVWDPYCGSGTTGVACLRLGRRFLGHEMQPHYAEIAAQRLEAETRGLTLQDVKRGQTSILDVMGGDHGQG